MKLSTTLLKSISAAVVLASLNACSLTCDDSVKPQTDPAVSEAPSGLPTEIPTDGGDPCPMCGMG